MMNAGALEVVTAGVDANRAAYADRKIIEILKGFVSKFSGTGLVSDDHDLRIRAT